MIKQYNEPIYTGAKFSTRSKNNLSTCDERLQDLFNEVIKYRDCSVLEGYRSEKTHLSYLRDGKTKVPYSKTKHGKIPSLAIDVAPYPTPKYWGADDWKERVKFYMLASVVKTIARQKGLLIRWGGDWDGDGDFNDQTFDDLVHYELIT